MLLSHLPTRHQKMQRALSICVLLLGVFFSSPAIAQTQSASDETTPYGTVYTYVEQMPVYPGGPAQLLQDLTASVAYPEAAVGTNVGGNVLVDFIVAPNGRIYEVKLNKGIVAGPGQEATAQALNEAAVAAVKRLKKKWQAGRQNGKAVAVSFTVPLAFAPSGR